MKYGLEPLSAGEHYRRYLKSYDTKTNKHIYKGYLQSPNTAVFYVSLDVSIRALRAKIVTQDQFDAQIRLLGSLHDFLPEHIRHVADRALAMFDSEQPATNQPSPAAKKR